MLAEASLAEADIRQDAGRVAAKVDALFSFYLAESGDGRGGWGGVAG